MEEKRKALLKGKKEGFELLLTVEFVKTEQVEQHEIDQKTVLHLDKYQVIRPGALIGVSNSREYEYILIKSIDGIHPSSDLQDMHVDLTIELIHKGKK